MITPKASELSHKIDLEQLGLPPPIRRPHRLRTSLVMRAITVKTTLTPENLNLPMFVVDGIDKPKLISSLPGVVQHTEDSLVETVREAVEVGISAVDLFGAPLDTDKDGEGSKSWNPESVFNRAPHRLRDELGNDILTMTDTCLDEFIDRGYCGVLGTNCFGNTIVENDRTLINYVKMAVTQASAGAHIVSLSSMMGGQIAAIREGLDAAGHGDVSIIAYSVKCTSVFYGSSRETVGNSLQGNRHTYQQNLMNRCESLLEAQLDVDEDADMVMVKPAMSYLDILREITDISLVPVAAYQVPGEYAMIHTVVANGWIDLDVAMMEAVLNIRRAGAEQILAYAAMDLAKKLRAQL